MGKNNAGILGQFTGKIGNIVGAVSRGVQTTRVYQPIVNNPKTSKQVAQRQILTDAVKFTGKICRAQLTPILKKKYRATTAYAQFLATAMLIEGGSLYENQERIQKFKTSFLTKSSLGYGFGKCPIDVFFKAADNSGFGFYYGDGTTILTNAYIGLTLPLNFYAGMELPRIFMYMLWFSSTGILMFQPFGSDPKGVEIEEFATFNEDTAAIIDGVVQANCGAFQNIGDTGAQYAVKVPFTGLFIDGQDSIVLSDNTAMATFVMWDSYNNVFSSENVVVPVVTE